MWAYLKGGKVNWGWGGVRDWSAVAFVSHPEKFVCNCFMYQVSTQDLNGNNKTRILKVFENQLDNLSENASWEL